MFRFIANLPIKWKLGLTTMLLTIPGCLLIMFPTRYSEYTWVFISLSGILLSIILNYFIAKPINRVTDSSSFRRLEKRKGEDNLTS